MILRIVGAILFVVIFNAIVFVGLITSSSLVGLIGVVMLGAIFLWWHLQKDAGWRPRHVLLRLRAPQASLQWVVLCCIATWLFAFGVVGFLDWLVPLAEFDPLPWWDAIRDHLASPVGWVAVFVAMVLVIPLVEEFIFRGRIQHRLERRYGPAWAIGVTSLLFMVMHAGVPHWSYLLVSLTLGIGMGIAVYLFRSIWVAVVIHCVWNGLLVVTNPLLPEPASGPLLPPSFLVPVSALLLALGIAGWYAILRAGRSGLRASVLEVKPAALAASQGKQ